MSAEWAHRMDLGTVQRNRTSEVRATLVENRDGPAVMLRRYHRSRHHSGMDAAPDALVIFAENIAGLVGVLERGRQAASALRGAA